jgi:hypothetical protein
MDLALESAKLAVIWNGEASGQPARVGGSLAPSRGSSRRDEGTAVGHRRGCRHGRDRWFLVALNLPQWRSIRVPTSILGPGRYRASLVSDRPRSPPRSSSKQTRSVRTTRRPSTFASAAASSAGSMHPRRPELTLSRVYPGHGWPAHVPWAWGDGPPGSEYPRGRGLATFQGRSPIRPPPPPRGHGHSPLEKWREFEQPRRSRGRLRPGLHLSPPTDHTPPIKTSGRPP